MPSKTTEREQDIQRAILDWLAIKSIHYGLWFGKVHTGPMQVAGGRKIKNPMAGFPDILCVWRGRAIGIEVKKPGQNQQAVQVEFQKEWEYSGGLYAVCRSVEDVEAAFKKFGI